MTQLDASVGSVTIGIPGVEVAIRQYGMLEWKSSNNPTPVQVASLNSLQGSSRVDSKNIMKAEVMIRERGSRNLTTKNNE